MRSSASPAVLRHPAGGRAVAAWQTHHRGAHTNVHGPIYSRRARAQHNRNNRDITHRYTPLVGCRACRCGGTRRGRRRDIEHDWPQLLRAIAQVDTRSVDERCVAALLHSVGLVDLTTPHATATVAAIATPPRHTHVSLAVLSASAGELMTTYMPKHVELGFDTFHSPAQRITPNSARAHTRSKRREQLAVHRAG